jgi:protein arginine kinase activator
LKISFKPLLRRIHGGSKHSGKVPVRAQSRVKILRELDQLKEELQVKVQNEEFEEAALLRDRIRVIEGKMQQEEPEKGDSQ